MPTPINKKDEWKDLSLQEIIAQLFEAIPDIVRQAVKEEFDYQKRKLQPLACAARLIGISPTVAHGYKRIGLLDGKLDCHGKIIPHDLLTIHLAQKP